LWWSIGGGFAGLSAATALALARRGVSVQLLEAEAAPGLAASGTNSGILHTGFDSVPGELETQLILRAAEHYGVHATGVTLSAQQRDHIAKRIADRGLTDRVTVRLQDYRELAEAGEVFDAVSSIEMGEHVGEDQYPTYAGILLGALAPTGSLLLQQMSRRIDAAPGGGAFIESYIAPDMHMRPLSQTIGFLEQAGFEIRDVEAMREHYVTTVRRWIDTFEAKYPQFVALVGEEVARVWRLYLVGGALSFEEGRMGVDQILATRPQEGFGASGRLPL